ncbi:MAG: helix-turn-helix domain-containing protein [Candidatus Ventricola sp.]
MARKTVLHFLRGYLAFLACLLVLLIPLYLQVNNLFEARQLSLTQAMLESGMARLDQQISSLSGIAFSIGQESDYRTFAQVDASQMTPSDYYQLGQLHAEFSRLCLAQPYVTAYGLILKNGVILTRERCYLPTDDYYGRFLRFGDMDQAEFLQTFGKPGNVSAFLPQMEVYRYGESGGETTQAVIWLCNMSQIASSNPTGAFYAAISCPTIASLLMPELAAEDVGLVLCRATGGELMRFGALDEDAKNVHTLTAAASASGLRATLRLSVRLFNDMMKPVRNLLYLCFGLLILVGLALSAFFAARASRPVEQLAELAHRVNRGGEGESSFELIGNTVTSLASSVDEYRQALAAQQMSVQAHCFERLLRETPFPAASSRAVEEFNRCFPSFPAAYRLAVIAIRGGDLEALPRMQVSLLGLAGALLSPAPYVYFGRRYAVIVLDSAAPGHQADALCALRRSALEKFDLNLLIALSGEGTSCAQLHALYQDAKSVIALARQEEPSGLVDVWRREHFPNQPSEFPLDYTEMSQLYGLLTRAECEGALSLIDTVRERLMRSGAPDELIVKQVYYNLRGILLRIKLERLELLGSVEIPDYHGEIDPELLFGQLSESCTRICGLLSPVLARSRTAFSASVLRFIDEHIADSALSVSMVADRFAISEPTLQKAIRQEKGCSFFEYVESRRYALALSLLRDTDQPIAQIAAQCGYNSVNSFYKAFKRMTNVTPAAMRQQLKQEQTEEEAT